MARLFGTDGVRGLANGDVTAEVALKVAQAAAQVLAPAGEAASSSRPRAVVARDPRPSGEFLEAAVVAGLAGSGIDVVRAGVLPTPAVAYLVAQQDADFGVMLSASHNAMPDNGIKFFGRGGHKLDDAVEAAIAAAVDQPPRLPVGADVGRVMDDASAHASYVAHLLASLPHRLDGLKVVVDCANGAASPVAPQVLREAGADVVVLHDDMEGTQINVACGSTYPQTLQAAVVEHGADAGIAHDGDADRCLAVDAAGTLVDGDQIMGILAVAHAESGRLASNTLVATVMSNLGLKIAMREAGIDLVETAVGDRYVLEEMRRGGFTVGGEQSGHVLLLEHSTTGDGILTALHVLAHVAHTGRTLAELATLVSRLPQVLINVAGVDRAALPSSQRIASAVSRAQHDLGDRGRVLLRPSGTEPLVRVMVEADTLEQAQAVAEELADLVRAELALP